MLALQQSACYNVVIKRVRKTLLSAFYVQHTVSGFCHCSPDQVAAQCGASCIALPCHMKSRIVGFICQKLAPHYTCHKPLTARSGSLPLHRLQAGKGGTCKQKGHKLGSLEFPHFLLQQYTQLRVH